VLAQQTRADEMVQYVKEQAVVGHPDADLKLDLLHFLKQQVVVDRADAGLKLDLLRFWSKYPYARFTPAIITRALDPNRRTDISQALDSFVKAHLLEKRVQQGLPFYCLTPEPSMRQWVFNMAAQGDSLRPWHRPFYC